MARGDVEDGVVDGAAAPAVAVVCGEWLEVGAGLGAGTVDFVYADPPFNTGGERRSPVRGGVMGRVVDAGYADDFGTAGAFVAWLKPRVEVMARAMKDTGLMCVHVDWRTSHRVRVMLDEVFGEDRFVNHVVWSYGLGGSSGRRFARKHDDLLLYCRDPERYWFDPPRVPATSNRLRGRTKKATDVLAIASLNNMAAERTGYPTQKPVALLEVLVRACCPAGGLVVDPCCGSGTTLVAAGRSGRRGLGFDVNPRAVEITRQRIGVFA